MRSTQRATDHFLHTLVGLRPHLVDWVEKRLFQVGRRGIHVGLEEGLILKTLCSQRGIEKVVEIGTQWGCSASWMALGLGAQGFIHTCEKEESSCEQALKTFAHPDFVQTGCGVRLWRGRALDSLKKLAPQGPFDLVFIDGDKSGYPDYYSWSFENLRPGGLLVADNVYLFGQMFHSKPPVQRTEKMWNQMRIFLESIFSQGLFHPALIPTQEGLLVATKV